MLKVREIIKFSEFVFETSPLMITISRGIPEDRLQFGLSRINKKIIRDQNTYHTKKRWFREPVGCFLCERLIDPIEKHHKHLIWVKCY